MDGGKGQKEVEGEKEVEGREKWRGEVEVEKGERSGEGKENEQKL